MENVKVDVFCKRLKYLMKEFDETTYSIADFCRLSPPTISRYARGEIAPKRTTINVIAEHFRVNPDWLAGFSSDIYETEILETIDEDIEVVPVKMFKQIEYNKPIFSNESYSKELQVPVPRIHGNRGFFGYLMEDESMEPLIQRGDKLVLKIGEELTPGKIHAVHVDKKNIIIRKILKQGDQIILQPANLDFDTEIYNTRNHDIQIIGRVIYKEHTEYEYL